HLFCDCPVARHAWTAALDIFHRLTGHLCSFSPRFVVTGRPEDGHDGPWKLDAVAAQTADGLHGCAVQAIWRLRCQVAMDDAPIPSLLVFREHVTLLAK